VAELEAEMEAAAAAKREVSRTPLLTKAISAKADAEPEHVAQIVRALLAQDEK
jgi:hypothetical protein